MSRISHVPGSGSRTSPLDRAECWVRGSNRLRGLSNAKPACAAYPRGNFSEHSAFMNGTENGPISRPQLPGCGQEIMPQSRLWGKRSGESLAFLQQVGHKADRDDFHRLAEEPAGEPPGAEKPGPWRLSHARSGQGDSRLCDKSAVNFVAESRFRLSYRRHADGNGLRCPQRLRGC